MNANPGTTIDPLRDCPSCPRLAVAREKLRIDQPGWWNAPVPGWGDPEGWLLIVGLAPGLQGGNRTGRPFTGDFAGNLLFETLGKLGLVTGTYTGKADDGLAANGVFITNAVACVPPENKPLPTEIAACRPFLAARIAAMPNLRAIVALGVTAHQSAVKALGGKLPKHPFAHGAQHAMRSGPVIFDSYHCSRYNVNTGRVTGIALEQVFSAAMDRRP